MKERNIWLDYLKAFAIYLVILGHTINNCISDGYESRICGIIYFIHIPMFLVISGMLAKDKPMNGVFWKGILLRFMIPYTTWTIILTTFYLGVGHLLHDSFIENIELYFSNWCHSFLWFIKVYVIVIVLWQSLKRLIPWRRFVVGTIVLIGINMIVQQNKALAELASLSLYAYTLFGLGAWLKKYSYKLKPVHIFLMLMVFVVCLPLATTSNNYFELSFGKMMVTGHWHVFFVRMIAGVCISMAIICCGKALYPPHLHTLQNIGKRTLQIYMLQSLLVEAALNRILCLPNTFGGYILAFIIAGAMTLLCYIIVEYSNRIKACSILLWGTSKKRK